MDEQGGTRMKIIIVGAGKVGYYTAKHLCQEDNDVVIIDKNQEVLQKAADDLDVMCIRGSGLSTRVLLSAGVQEADLIIAATTSDEINMLCCLTGKRLGVKHTIARIRDPEYSYELSVLKKEMGLDMVINPEQESAGEIARVLRFPAAINIETFVNGRVEMVAFRVRADDIFCGQTLMQTMSRLNVPIVFCAVLRQDKVMIPNGNTRMEAGDLAYIVGEPPFIHTFFKKIGRYSGKTKNVLIIGGGKIARYLCEDIAEVGIRAKIIERDYKVCESLSEGLPNCVIIHGDGSDEAVLHSENMGAFDSVVTLTGRDEENLLVALYASQMGVPKVIAKINRPNYEEMIRGFGIDSVVSPKSVTASQIIRFVRALKNSMGCSIETLYKIVDNRVEALVFLANDTTQHLGEPFKDVQFRKNFIVAAIERRGKVIIPSGSDCIEKGDRVVIVSTEARVETLNDVFEKTETGGWAH